MKIDSSIKPSNGVNVSEVRSRPLAKASGGAQANAASDVQLSGLSAQIQQSSDAPSYDAARVSEIKLAIAEGRFTINTGAIADRLIASARELVNSQRQA